jgi:prepilin-type N-terminal cleavage/methylation domain-containing protein
MGNCHRPTTERDWRPATRWPGRGRSGQTLLEVLLSLVLLAIISMGTSLLYVQALRMYKRGGREATSRDKAALALEHILPELQDAYNVEYPGPEAIILTRVARSANGTYVVDPVTRSLLPGGEVIFYVSDRTATLEQFTLPPPPVDPAEEEPDPDVEPDIAYRGVPGTYLWRAERASSGVPWGNCKLICEGVESAVFASAPGEDALDLVSVAITVGEGQGPGYFNRTEMGAVKVRNH